MSLKKKFSMDDTAESKGNNTVIVNLPDMKIALEVDEVLEIGELNAEKIVDMPRLAKNEETEYLDRVASVDGDLVILLTAREEAARERTLAFIKEAGVRVDHVFFQVPMGERILINDTKPSGLVCALTVNPSRNQGLEDLKIVIDQNM